MKNQLDELMIDQANKLRKWWKPDIGDLILITDKNFKGYERVIDDIHDNKIRAGSLPVIYIQKSECLPLLSIGQMIQLLLFLSYEESCCESTLDMAFRPLMKLWTLDGPYISEEHVELTDALWIAVKENL